MQVFNESERNDAPRKAVILPVRECAPHFHAQVEILCVTSGVVTATVGDETLRVNKGGICVAGSYETHSYAPECESNGVVIQLPIELLQKFFGFTVTQHFLQDESLFASVMSLITLYGVHGHTDNALFAEGWCNTVLGVLYEPLQFVPAESGNKADTIREVLAYIRENYAENLTLNEVANRFGYSPYHFSRLFNHCTNIGFKRYVNSVRLEAVAQQLRNGESVNAAARNCGFNSVRSFYRSFTEYYGETPQRYARKYKNR